MISERLSAKPCHSKSGREPASLFLMRRPLSRRAGTVLKNLVRNYGRLPVSFRGSRSRSAFRRRKKTGSPAAASRIARSPDGRPAILPAHFPKPAGCPCVPALASAVCLACLRTPQNLPGSSARSEDTPFVGDGCCFCPF